MTAIERAIFRTLYREACFGAGAAIRRSARASMEEMIREAGVPFREAFESNCLDMTAYFATKPIGG